MKYHRRIVVLEKKVGSKDMKISLLKYLPEAREREKAVSKEEADIIVWYFSDSKPKKWTNDV